MPPLPLIPNMPAGMTDINWGAMNPTTYGAPATYDPYTAVDEARKRAQLESDRDYQLRAKQIKQQAEQIAISKGQAKANEWYQKQMVQLSKDKFKEEQRQFNVTSSGYLDSGAPTLAREQFQDNSLRGWTQDAIKLASTPKDWVAYKRMTSGVANNIGSIPGLSWAAGGQIGNQTFAGNPETNSLSNVMGAMGVNVGQGGAATQQASGGNWASAAAQQAQSIAQSNPAFSNQENQIYQTADEFSRNPQGAASDWYEQLDPMTRELIQGASEAQGHDWSTVMARYKRSRWGGGGSSVAA